MNVISSIKSKIISYLLNRYDKRSSRDLAKVQLKYAKKISLAKLNDDEINKIKQKWGEIIPIIEDGYIAYQIFKSQDRFDPNYIPSGYYYPYVIRALNLKHSAYTYEDKGMLCNYFRDVKQPNTVLRCVRDTIYDCHNQILTLEQAAEHIVNQNKDLIIKRSLDSCGGKNIQIISAESTNNEILQLLKEYNENYIIQELIKQSPATAIFNPTSVNTIRVTSMLINGKFSICNRILRCGGLGNFVDNGGAGGVMVGIDNDGCLMSTGYTFDGRKHTEHNNQIFAGYKLPNINIVDQMVCYAHSQIPSCGLAGWDIALDENDSPILIEVNLSIPGVFGEQLCCGPMFGDRTQEVIDYVKTHKHISRLFY